VALQHLPTLTEEGFPWVRLALSAVIGTVTVMGLGQAMRKRWEGQHPDLVHNGDARALIKLGESHRVEFKSSARWNTHTGGRDERLEQVIVKTIAGFSNAAGGTLIIGVDDSGSVVGIENDYLLLRHGDRDRYELWLHDLIGAHLGLSVARSVTIRFQAIEGRDICRIDVSAGASAVFVRNTKNTRSVDFYLRIGNSTRYLLADEVLEYASVRWPKYKKIRLPFYGAAVWRVLNKKH
jgi:hypothetical protein